MSHGALPTDGPPRGPAPALRGPKRQTSQLQMDSLTSVVLSAVLIPPMPLVSLRGEDAEDTLGSSHDLLNRVIAVHAVEQRWAADLELDLVCKQSVLSRMHQRVRAAVQTCIVRHRPQFAMSLHAAARDAGVLEQCYVAFQDALREYLATYTATHPDVRIAPMDAVGADHVIMRQGREHIAAIDASFERADGQPARVRPGLQAVTRYSDVIALYVELLAEMEE